MYSVVIADDEIKIREGLRDLVDWNGLGFRLMGTYCDGSEVLEVLATAHVDLVVTDIKMNRISGLEVSEYIFQNCPKTRVILISGYKEVELAMKAIKFGVEDYILKPVDLDELTSSLSRMRGKLDNEKDEKNRQQKLTQVINDMSGMKALFFEELLMGSLSNQSYIKKMFELIYPALSFNSSACFSLTLKIQHYQHFIKEEWLRSRSELHEYITNFVSMVAIDSEIQLISKQNERLQLFGLLFTPFEEPISQTLKRDVDALCAELKSVFGLNVQADHLEIWPSIPVMLEGNEIMTEKNAVHFMEQFNEQQRILYYALQEGNLEEISLGLDKYVTLLKRLSFSSAQDTVKNFFYTISAKSFEDAQISAATKVLEGALSNIEAATTHSQLENILEEAFRAILSTMQNDNQEMIHRAKEFILQHVGEDISLEDVAERFYLSQYHFSRTFKAKTGETVIKFIIRSKMDYAARLLKETNLKVYEVCEKSGYQSLRHFTKLFKSHKGLTPSVYRQRIRMEVH